MKFSFLACHLTYMLLLFHCQIRKKLPCPLVVSASNRLTNSIKLGPNSGEPVVFPSNKINKKVKHHQANKLGQFFPGILQHLYVFYEIDHGEYRSCQTQAGYCIMAAHLYNSMANSIHCISITYYCS